MELEAIKDLLLHSASPQVRALTTAFLHSFTLNPKLAGSILIELSTRFFGLLSPDLATVTARNDLDFHLMLDTPTALFLSVPTSEKERVKPLTATLMAQMMRTFTRNAEATGGTLRRSVVFYLDEFANIGVIPHFLEYISLVRSMGISFLLVLQDFGQLKRIYGGEGYNTILANCNTQVIFPGCGPAETEHYSRLLGNQTISTTSSAGSFNLFGPNTTTITTTSTGRSLMTPDELRTMYLGNLLVISDVLRPFIVQNRTYIERPEMMKRIGLPAPTQVTEIPPDALTPEAPVSPSTPKTATPNPAQDLTL